MLLFISWLQETNLFMQHKGFCWGKGGCARAGQEAGIHCNGTSVQVVWDASLRDPGRGPTCLQGCAPPGPSSPAHLYLGTSWEPVALLDGTIRAGNILYSRYCKISKRTKLKCSCVRLVKEEEREWRGSECSKPEIDTAGLVSGGEHRAHYGDLKHCTMHLQITFQGSALAVGNMSSHHRGELRE